MQKYHNQFPITDILLSSKAVIQSHQAELLSLIIHQADADAPGHGGGVGVGGGGGVGVIARKYEGRLHHQNVPDDWKEEAGASQGAKYFLDSHRSEHRAAQR